MSFLTECVAPEDCPNGGINFKCIANECECPNPFVLDGNKCVGMVKILFVVFSWTFWSKDMLMILSLSKEKGIEQFEGFTCPVNNGFFHSK